MPSHFVWKIQRENQHLQIRRSTSVDQTAIQHVKLSLQQVEQPFLWEKTIAFEARANDANIDDNLLHVEWISDKMEDPWNPTPNSSGDVAFTFSDLSIDSHTVTMTVSDEKGATCSDFIIVTVGTLPPLP